MKIAFCEGGFRLEPENDREKVLLPTLTKTVFSSEALCFLKSKDTTHVGLFFRKQE